MAVGNISGPLLTANLLRNGKDLAFETDLLFLNVSDPDPANFKVGIGTSSPAYLLDVGGITRSTNIKSTEADIGNVNIKNNTIKSSIDNLTIQAASGADKIIFSSNFESDYSGKFDSMTLTNALPVSSGGTGVGTSTGTGDVVLSNSPTLVTPNIGAATADSINKLIITEPTTSATLTVNDGASLITSGAFSLTLTTTADTDVTFPITGLLVNSDETTLSSLESVGTITTGTWSADFGAVSGANLTDLTADNLTGTIPSTVLGSSSLYIGTTSIALNRASDPLTLTDVNFGTTDVSASFTIPVGTVAARPVTPDAGNIRYNTDTSNYEGYTGTDWLKIGSGLTPTSVKISDYTATEAQLVRCDSTNGSFSVFLPATPQDGCVVGILDIADSFVLYPVLVKPALNTTVEGDNTSLGLDVNGAYISLIYSDTDSNWKIQETPNMLSNFQLALATTTNSGAVKVDGNTIVINSQGVISAVSAGNTDGTILSVIGTTPIVSSGGTTPTISILQSSATTNGYLSSTDWNIFNNKLSSLPIASQFLIGGVKVGAGLVIDSSGVLSATGVFSLPAASPSTVGGIRIGTGLIIDVNGIVSTTNFVKSVSAVLPMISSGGNMPVITIQVSSATTNGYLSSTDWNIFNSKIGAIPVASANILGGIKIGSGLSIDNYGILNATSSYILPLASDTTVGGVKIDGTTIRINQSGAIASYGKLVLQIFTSNATPQALTIDADVPDIDNQLVINNNESIMFTGLLIAKQQASPNIASYTLRCTAVNDSGTITIVSSLITNIDDTIGISTGPAFNVDTLNNAISLSSGAKALTNIKWTATLDLATAAYA